ncbi:MAG TPA: Gfo/Idh/MocA family oxidoreductase [Planctomycetota bacterium]|nr:Gfo/Idh/MocA family oxidoreductase [Planctomycetota bacterium]
MAGEGRRAKRAEGMARREFLRFGAAAAAGAAALGGRLTVLAADAPAQKLGVAVVGARGMGGYSLDQGLRERLVAIVEIEDKRAAEAMKIVQERAKDAPPPKVYTDYRKMLDECHKDLDVVLTGTPDHHHAPASIRAIQLGKHAFAQKPLAHNIYECYALAKAAREKKVCTQMGNQGYCDEGMRRLVEFTWAGAIGNITETHTILGRNFGGSGGRPASKPVPAGLHWDEWLGPAPHRDYHDGLHPFSWRSWRQFGTGTIGDMACHHLARIFWPLKIYTLKKFSVTCLHTKGGSEEMYPQDNVLLWELPEREGQPPCKVYAYDHGDLKPEVMKEVEKKYDRKFGEASLLIGDKGLMGHEPYIITEERRNDFKPPEKTLPRAHGGPIEDLFWCIRNGGTPASNFPDAAGPLTAWVLTGHLAMFAGVGKKLDWDVEKMECTNMPEINRFVKREYRKGWEV